MKNDSRGFPLRALSLEIPGFLGDATDETDNYRFGTGLRSTAPKDRAKSERCYRSSRSFSSASPLRPFFIRASSFLLPRPFRTRIEATSGGISGAAYLNHISRAKVCLLFFQATFSRAAPLFHCRRGRRHLTFLSSRSTAAESRFFDLRVI